MRCTMDDPGQKKKRGAPAKSRRETGEGSMGNLAELVEVNKTLLAEMKGMHEELAEVGRTLSDLSIAVDNNGAFIEAMAEKRGLVAAEVFKTYSGHSLEELDEEVRKEVQKREVKRIRKVVRKEVEREIREEMEKEKEKEKAQELPAKVLAKSSTEQSGEQMGEDE